VVSRRHAFAQLQIGNLQEAQDALQAATRKDPQDEAAQVLLARVFVARQANEPAGAALQAAVAVDPFDPELHDAWIALAKNLKDEKLAAREKRALLLSLGKKPQAGSEAAADPAPHQALPAPGDR
jgi:thioredoxin-like negative regulator of GroEL